MIRWIEFTPDGGISFGRVESYQQEAVSRIEIQAESVMRRMSIELESGGNVRFEEGITSDVW